MPDTHERDGPQAQEGTLSAPKTILIVEDEALVALDMESTLSDLGHETATATTVVDALQLLETGRFGLAIVDYHLKDGSADQLGVALRARNIPFIVCSGSAGLQEFGEVFQGTPFLAKPFTTDGLLGAVSVLTSRAGDLH